MAPLTRTQEPSSRRRRITSFEALAAFAAVLVLIPSMSALASPSDVSSAVRYGSSAPLGAPIAGLSNRDDDVEVVSLPATFPINFFGEKFNALCVTTNGGVYPVDTSVIDPADPCSNRYDKSVAQLAIESNAPMIAALAADIDLRKDAFVLSDAFGVAGEIYYDDGLTVDGREAVALTWYRVSMWDNENDADLANTFQIVLIKGATGDATVGFDFTIEFNYGTLTDNEDGYKASDPTSGCSVSTPAEQADCRWGIGWSDFKGGVAIASISVNGGVATLTTGSAHGIGESASEIRLVLPDSTADSLALNGDTVTATRVDATTLRFPTSAADHGTVTPSGLQLSIGEGYELFADTPINDLIDTGRTAMVNNSLGTSVEGRYLFGMTGGVTTGFEVPTLAPVAETPTEPDVVSGPVAVAVARAAELEGGGSVLVRGSAPVPVTTTIATDAGPRGGLVIEDEDGSLTVTVTTSGGVTETAGVVVPVGGEIVCEICARLAAGSVVEAWTYSTARLTAAVRVEVDAEEGTCPLLRIPTGTPLDGGGAIEAGVHTLQLRMFTDDGFEVLAIPITVGGPVPSGVPSGEGPAVPVGPLTGLLGLAAASWVSSMRRRQRAARPDA